MKCKFSPNGHLLIKRKGQWVIQYCPDSPENTPCGHWCPRFNELGIIEGEESIGLDCAACARYALVADEREEKQDEPGHK